MNCFGMQANSSEFRYTAAHQSPVDTIWLDLHQAPNIIVGLKYSKCRAVKQVNILSKQTSLRKLNSHYGFCKNTYHDERPFFC